MKYELDEGGTLYIIGHGMTIELALLEIFDAMSEEETQRCATAISWDAILDEAVKRLTASSDCWAGDDDRLSLGVLCEMERFVLSGFRWRMWAELERASRVLARNQEAYYAMRDAFGAEQADDLWRRAGLPQHFVHDRQTGDDAHDKFAVMVEAKLGEVFAGLPKPKESDHA